MSNAPIEQTPSASAEPMVRPPLERDIEQAWVAGVASGLARHLNWPIWLARMGFIGLTITSFVGIGLYAALWILMPRESSDTQNSPGLVAASHQNMRPKASRDQLPNLGRITSVAMLVFGIIMLVQGLGLGISRSLFGPALLASIGVALVWLQADSLDSNDQENSNLPTWLRPFIAGKGILAVLRVVLGISLVGLAVSVVGPFQFSVATYTQALWVSSLTVGGLGVLAAPWLLRYRRKLAQAHEEKLVADTRADMAAHLHDSVLQTLALIQRQADNPVQVAGLARRQERELRNWLYGEVHSVASFKEALTNAADEVDQERGVPIELVCVGDIELNEQLTAMVQAAREAMLNAAKHSAAAVIDVYAEVEAQDDGRKTVQIFVRDRGKGFDISAIGEDRMGVRHSIIERMERHGGKALIRSEIGAGTEIRLEMTI